MSNFVQLHLHTQLGSQLDGIGDSSEYAKLAKEKGHKALSITDHGKLNGFFRHYEECVKNGIKPIFGVEAYVEFILERYDDKEKRIRNKNMHLILLAKNEIGYKNLLKLNYLSMSDTKHFYYRNHISLKELFLHKEGIIVGSGCGASPFNTLFREGKEDKAEKLYKLFVDQFKDDFYTELQMSEIFGDEEDNFDQKKINDFELRMAKKFNRTVVLSGDVHYSEKGKDLAQTIAIAVRNKQTLNSLKFEIKSKSLYYHDVSDYKNFNSQWNYGYTDSQIEEWCGNTILISDKINYIPQKRKKALLPSVSSNDNILLRKKTLEGFERLFKKKYDDCPQNYKERLQIELDAIILKGMATYILILEDIFRFVDREEIMRGPGRGSAAGSLVLYCLDITTIDPIKHGLYFERFLSKERSPDVICDYFN